MRARDRAAGFSLIELMIVLGIVALLLRVALPAYSGIRRDSYASQAAGDFNTVRAAAVAQYEATGSYPASGASGQPPAGMAPYLPRDFSFTRPAYQLEWDNFAVNDTTGGSLVTGQVLAVTVTAADSLTGLVVLRTLGANCTHWSVGNAHTFVVMSTLEAPH